VYEHISITPQQPEAIPAQLLTTSDQCKQQQQQQQLTRMFFSPLDFLSRPYAMAAAVGSLMMRATFRPEMVPASLVACAV
jgi:hypothetical protein